MKIFVVEGDADLRAFLEAAIDGDHDVRSFEDGRRAMVELDDSAPDLLLIDLPPLATGSEELAVAAARLSPRPRIVLMSVDHLRLERYGRLGQARLAKPFAVRDLMEALGTAY